MILIWVYLDIIVQPPNSKCLTPPLIRVETWDRKYLGQGCCLIRDCTASIF